MLISLITTALLMGLAGIPHCAAMCATPCAVAVPNGLPVSALLGRSVGYAILGAVAAGATAALASWSRFSAVLQPFWVMFLAASALLGAWMLIRGEMPQALQSQGLAAYRALQRRMNSPQWLTRHPRSARMLPALLGAAWAALPCGLLYGAVTVAALASTAWQGACVMLAFSLPGAVALWWWPRQLKVWQRSGDAPPQASEEVQEASKPSWQGRELQAQAVVPVLWVRAGDSGREAGAVSRPPASVWWLKLVDPLWALRLSGLCLVLASSWALWHRLLDQWRAWCA
jgi:uncharacterized protein